MIAHLSGKLISKGMTASVVDCQGVGYEVFHTPFCAEKLTSETVSLFIHTQVREDAIQLFGFAQPEERAMFRELLRVNGIGPKMALTILSAIPHEELSSALASKDAARLQRIPGIGKKTAERLSVELSDRLAQMKWSQISGDASTPPRDMELESVLLNLGYQKSEIQKALKALRSRETSFESMPLETLVKSTLRELTQGRPV